VSHPDDHIIRDEHGNEAEVRWRDRTQQIFHDVAELLGTTTDLIMAANQKGRSIVAMYTPGYPDDKTIWNAGIRVNADGTLRLIHRERSKLRWDQMEADIEARMREKFGPPPGEGRS
jgi:hypothetical protein